MKVLEVDPIHHRIVLAATGFPQEEVIVEVKEELKEEFKEDAKEPGPADA
jgi:hypothetical protein